MSSSSAHRTLAMWSGPRNISTAMMRSFENRADCQVTDEPFYAAYLHDTGVDHPMRKEILLEHETDWRQVVKQCLAPAHGEARINYQKQMCHHILPKYSREWMRRIDHCFLLRSPEDVLKSYSVKREQVELHDIGLPQQQDLYAWICEHGERKPLVIDSADFLTNPEAYLRAICTTIDIEFDSDMLQWSAGKRDSDGVWASHWYNQVWKSTGFNAPKVSTGELDESLASVLAQAQPIYEDLHRQRLVV